MNDTFDKVILCIREVFESKRQQAPSIDEGTRLDASLGLESLDYAELVVRLEGVFGTDPFAEGVPPGLQTVGDLVALYRAA
jgi:acyl carrier protein